MGKHGTRIVGIAALLSVTVIGQVSTNVPEVVPGARPVTVERIRIHGRALEGNLEGNAVDREAIIVLPPGYQAERTRRYPVVYALHGYSIGAEHILDTYKVMHAFEIYPGTHTSHVAFRFQDHVMPFFSTSLSFAAARR